MWNLFPLLGNMAENGLGSLTTKKSAAKQPTTKQASTTGIIKNNHSSSQPQGIQQSNQQQGIQPQYIQQSNRQQRNQQQGNQQQGKQQRRNRQQGNQYQGNQYQGNQYQGNQYQGNQYQDNQYRDNQQQGNQQQVIQQHNKKTSADLVGTQDKSLDGKNILEYKFKKEEFTYKLMELLMNKLKTEFIRQLEKRPALFKYNILWNLQYSNRYKTIFDALVDYIDSKTQTKQKYLKYKSKYIALKRLIMLGVN